MDDSNSLYMLMLFKMVENKELINKLMSDNAGEFSSIWDDSSENEKLMTASRVVQIRYRFYAVWVLLIILIVLFRLILPGLDTYDEKNASIATARANLQELEQREDQYKRSIWFLNSVQENSEQIISCVDRDEMCHDIPEEIQENSGLARSYILACNMDDTKMDVNERKIIENIDMFLLRLEPFANDSSVNWELTRILIWDKVSENWLYTVPVQIDVTFDDKGSLLSFISNVEQYIPEDENKRILYKIDKITYDIVNSEEPQETTIYMNLYYYDE